MVFGRVANINLVFFITVELAFEHMVLEVDRSSFVFFIAVLLAFGRSSPGEVVGPLFVVFFIAGEVILRILCLRSRASCSSCSRFRLRAAYRERTSADSNQLSCRHEA